MQVDGFFFICSILKNHFGALGIAAAEKYYSPVPLPLPGKTIECLIAGNDFDAG
jgi:hypothetical protein